MSSMSKPLIYVVLANLGSPESPTTDAVSVYLRDFLSDPRVVDANPIWWKPLLKLIRFRRSPRVAKVYQSVWIEKGSPLLVLQEQLCRKLEKKLATVYSDFTIKVVSAMTYREPNITTIVQDIFKTKPEKVILLPMYPQFSSSTTLPVIDGFNRAFQDKNTRFVPPYSIINNYYKNPFYIKAIAESIKEKVNQEVEASKQPVHQNKTPVVNKFVADNLATNCQDSDCQVSGDKVLDSQTSGNQVSNTSKINKYSSVEPKDYFSANNKLFISFHGIPTRFVEPLGDPYQEHCNLTVKLLAKELALSPEQYQLCYQSKFGKEPWLTPATDESLEKFAQSTPNAQAMVVCPGFSIDCIETLEEIEEENKENFIHAGGKKFSYVPCLNDNDSHVSLMLNIISKELER